MKRLFGLLAIVILGIAGWLAATPQGHAPDVTFSTLSGKQLTMQELRGKVVLVKFWATSCVTCVGQMPADNENFRKYNDQGFEVVAVAMQYDPANYVVHFAESQQLPFTIAIDTRGLVAKAFGDVTLTPTAFLIDKNGLIIKRYQGDYDKAAFQASVEKALAS